MIDLTRFQGEIPRVHPRMLPPGFAQASTNVKFENGALTPYRQPKILDAASDVVGTGADSIYKAPEGWLWWTNDVDVVQGPVAQDRLYYTGNGAPKIRVAGTPYNLAITAPSAKAEAAIKPNSEYLTVENREVLLRQDRTAKTSSGSVVTVSVAYNTATVIIAHPTGLTVNQAQSLVNSLKYRNGNTGAYVVPSLKLIRLIRIKDNGGQQYDSNRNPIGSDTRALDDIGTTVKVAGTTLDYSFPTPVAQSSTDETGQNDPPTLAVTGLAPSYNAGDAAVSLFSGCSISTIESGQMILELRLTVENLANGAIDPKTSETLVYSYTYVSQFDEESAPAPLSNQILWSPGQGIRLSGLAASSQTPRINRKRIYRSQTSATGATDLYLIGEIDNNTGIFDDVPDTTPLQEPIPSLDYDMPPDDLSGLVTMPNGIMAAFVGRTLYFCEPYRPHAWPQKYTLKTDFSIVGLATAGATLVVMTKGCPYIVQGTHPDNMRMERIEVNYPCNAKRSIVDLGYSVAYSTSEGLVQVDQSGARLVTRGLFTQRQWNDLAPSTFICSQHQGRYIISHDDVGTPVKRRCTVIDMTGEMPFVIRTSWRPRCFFFEIGTGRLFFHNSGNVYEFDSQYGPYEQMRWRSQPFLMPSAINLGAILLNVDKVAKSHRVICHLYADGRKVSSTPEINKIARLPSGYRAVTFEVEIVGNAQVTGIHLARTIDEMLQRENV